MSSFEDRRREKDRRDLIEALTNLVCSGGQVSVPNTDVARASYRLDEETNTFRSHGTFTVTMRPTDMTAFNGYLDQAHQLLMRLGEW